MLFTTYFFFCLTSPHVALMITYWYDHLIMKYSFGLAKKLDKYFNDIDQLFSFLPETFELYVELKPYMKEENFIKMPFMYYPKPFTYYPRPIILMTIIPEIIMAFVFWTNICFWFFVASVIETSKFIYNNSIVAMFTGFTIISLILSKNV